jgi:hypothetical protein
VPPTASGTSTSAPAVTATGVPAETLPKQAFGMHVNKNAEETWPKIPIGSVRIWNADSTWGALEKSRGSWSFGPLDTRIERAERSGASVVLVLAQPPKWAATRPELRSLSGSPSPPKSIDDWRNYVTTVAERYRGRIEAYEIWNEPNLPQFFVGTPQDLALLTRTAATAIRAVDPAAKIVSAGFSARTPGSEPYFQQYVQAGIADSIDIVGIHIYPYPGNGPESMVALAERFRSLADSAGLADKPMWNTEIGYGRNPASVISGAAAASLILRTYLVLPAIGLERNYWYAWDDRAFVGLFLVEADRSTPSAAGRAYELAEQWLAGASVPECSADEQVWTCQLVLGGVPVRVMWSLGAAVSVPAPPGTTRTYTFTDGSATVSPGEPVEIGTLPVVLAPTEVSTLR